MSLNRQNLSRALAHEGTVVRVVIAAINGSTPREAGAEMLVWSTGQSGTIGGGALELQATQAARAMLRSLRAPRLSRVPLGPGLGQCCGGAVTLVSEVFDNAALNALPDTLRAVSLTQSEMPLAVHRALAQARNGSTLGQTRLIDGWLVEPVSPPAAPLWIYGAGHVGRALIQVLAPLPQFEITWVDTAHDRFPDHIPDGVAPLVAADPALACTHAPVDAHHLILTYSHALDLELCHRLLLQQCASVGLIGSASKWARFRSRLAALGHPPTQIDRIQCPIGDPSLGKHPQAIAVGVASTLLSMRTAHSAAKDATA